MADSVVTPLGLVLPDRWALRPLGEMCSKIGSGATPKGGSSVYVASGISFIRSQNVFDHKFSAIGLAYINAGEANRLSGVRVQERDVLLNITGDGETIARCCTVPASVLPARVNQHVMIIRVNGDLVPEFLQRYLSHPAIREYMLSHNSGGSRRALTKGQVEKFLVVAPPLHVQGSIAAVLGALDDKIAVNERIRETSVALAISRFEKAIDGSISTPTTTLGELAAARQIEISDGYRTKKSEHDYPGIPILRVSEVSGSRITPSFSDFVSDEFRRQMGNKISCPGDVILTTKGTVGRTAMMPRGEQEFVYSPQICFFRVAQSSPISAELLLLWMSSQEFWRQAASLKGQTDMADYLSLRDIRSMEITVPNPEVHRRIQDAASLLLMQAETRQQESDTLVALRDTLLPQLMSGKLRIRDAERIVEDAL